MAHDGAHGDRHAGLVGLHLVVDRPHDAMRGGEHQVARQRGAGAQIVARIHQHHDRARRPAVRGRRIAGHRESGRDN